ncbi:fimbrial protein [Stenotrophomonas sepilia]|uniref:fimbrial protein n=1 Tax=Stenotrophomonas sepilia TaxID=2860290 RepID=UPI0033424EA7
MNKLAIALTAALSLGAAASASAASTDVTFTGEILDATCSISVGTGGSGTAVTLRKVAIADVTGAVTARSTPFTLVAGGGGTGGTCPAGDLKMSFTGANAEGKLSNTGDAADDAKGVQLALAHKGTVIDLNNDEIKETVDAGGKATYNLEARYEQVGTTKVEKGNFAAAVKIDVFY